MSIQILEGSHTTHITPSVITVTTKYLMNIGDFYAGWGIAMDGYGNIINTNFRLPTIGDKYIYYHYLSDLVGTFWEDVVLSDITEERKTAIDTQSVDYSAGWDLTRKTEVTYTWSNSGKKDIVVPGDESSLKFTLKTNTEIETTDVIIDSVTGVETKASDLYFTKQNPTIYFTNVDDEGNSTTTSKGAYVGNTAAWKKYHRDNNESPAHEIYKTSTILTVTAYSKNSYTFYLSDNINKINSIDFLEVPYVKRENRLSSKNKGPTYKYTDIYTQDDTEKWLFYDFSKDEFGGDLYKYELYFLYNKNKWTTWYGSTVNEYSKIDFYSVLLDPLFDTVEL